MPLVLPLFKVCGTQSYGTENPLPAPPLLQFRIPLPLQLIDLIAITKGAQYETLRRCYSDVMMLGGMLLFAWSIYYVATIQSTTLCHDYHTLLTPPVEYQV